MGLSKPYYRIARPKAYIPNYVTDDRYAFDRLQLSRAYVNIEKQLRDIFNHIEPDEANKNTFSFELYTLLLRACTEVDDYSVAPEAPVRNFEQQLSGRNRSALR